jgi:hypothetical protein
MKSGIAYPYNQAFDITNVEQLLKIRSEIIDSVSKINLLSLMIYNNGQHLYSKLKKYFLPI